MRHINIFAPVRSTQIHLPVASTGRNNFPLTGGFAILEVAMATFVLAFGIATAIVAMQAGFRHLDLARGTTLAAQIIQSEMERIRMMSWTGVSAIPATETFDGATNFSSTSRIVGRYSVTRTLTADTARPTEVMNISIAVTWRTYDGRPHTPQFQQHLCEKRTL